MAMTRANAWEIVEQIRSEKDRIRFGEEYLTIDDVLKMYDPNRHDVHDPSKRLDKIFDKDTDVVDDSGREKQKTGETGITYVNRTSVPYQKMIVERANSFLTGNPVEYQSNIIDDMSRVFSSVVNRVMESNKMDFNSQIIGEKYLSETECAELWYIVDDSDKSASDYYGLDYLAIEIHLIRLHNTVNN